MRKITADLIFPIATDPIKNGVVIIDDNGTLLEVLSSKGAIPDEELEVYKGAICPGFINAHCHLELSHLRGVISEKAGMTGFIKELLSKRNNFSAEATQQAILEGEAEMIKNGIVAVGDISNNNSTFPQKKKENLYYHTFVEVFDMLPWKADEVFNKGKILLQELSGNNSKGSITPHAPYTVSNELFKRINDFSSKNIISLHNQESEAENELFISKSGKFIALFTQMELPLDHFSSNGFNSLRVVLPQLDKCLRILLVHNTFSSKEDIHWANRVKQDVYWCTCPNANLYIENRLPEYEDFIRENVKMTIGTDSLASNWSLSILDELKTIAKYYPKVSLQTLLKWATINGAEFLGIQNKYGTIEKGKKPGLVCINNLSGDSHLTEKSAVKVI